MDEIFERESLRLLGDAYPLAPAMLRHNLAGHPLLESGALEAAAGRLDPALVEVRAAIEEISDTFGERADTYRTDGWTMLKFVEQLPEYRRLIDEVIEEIMPVVKARTGSAHRPRGFIFVSAPGTATPYHVDPEYNLLFQIAGTKTFAVHPSAPPWMPSEAHPRLHLDGDNVLTWHEGLAKGSQVLELAPGDVLYVPYKSPHWVRVGPESSISLSVTWQSAWTDAQRDAHRFAARIGLEGPNKLWPSTPHLRALGGRLLDRAMR